MVSSFDKLSFVEFMAIDLLLTSLQGQAKQDYINIMKEDNPETWNEFIREKTSLIKSLG